MALGAEMVDLTRPDVDPTNTQNWLTMIAGIRAIYSGKLAYFAQWANDNNPADWMDEKDALQFWPELDFVGTTEYPNIGDALNPSTLAAGWAQSETNQDIIDFANKYKKPFLFGEIGYINAPDSGINPWDWGKFSESDSEVAQGKYV